MTQLIITAPDMPLSRYAEHIREPACVVTHFASSQLLKLGEVQSYDDLNTAVAQCDSILVCVHPEQWDDLLLGDKGILVSISEGVEIINAGELDDARHNVYNHFLSSKNLSYIVV